MPDLIEGSEGQKAGGHVGNKDLVVSFQMGSGTQLRTKPQVICVTLRQRSCLHFIYALGL